MRYNRGTSEIGFGDAGFLNARADSADTTAETGLFEKVSDYVDKYERLVLPAC
jgi:hypothetical protein